MRALTIADLGPVSLPAPVDPPRHVRAAHGHLWQWVGDGLDLYSLSVAVRTTRLGNQAGVRDHLAWEVDQISESLDGGAGQADRSDVLVLVDGATGSAAADVSGRRLGSAVRNRLIVTTDGRHMHVVRVLVPDHDTGRELAEAVTAALRVEPWTMPA